ncbi:MAG: hypothetical protein LUE99_17485 [Bacteroides sp.]|nr:hypothetical protein [Bacteroides sp.]
MLPSAVASCHLIYIGRCERGLRLCCGTDADAVSVFPSVIACGGEAGDGAGVVIRTGIKTCIGRLLPISDGKDADGEGMFSLAPSGLFPSNLSDAQAARARVSTKAASFGSSVCISRAVGIEVIIFFSSYRFFCLYSSVSLRRARLVLKFFGSMAWRLMQI